MSTIASRVWTNYHLDTVHEGHPLRESWIDLEERARIMIREHLRQRRIE